jgi:hypothetical protein
MKKITLFFIVLATFFILLPQALADLIPPPPTGLTATYNCEWLLNKISWDVVPEAVSYNWYWDTEPGVTKDSNYGGNPSNAAIQHYGVVPGWTYYYRVSSVDSEGNESDLSLEEASASVPFAEEPEGVIDVWVTNVYYDGGADNGYLITGGWGDHYYSLIAFDIEDLPSNVNSAKIRLYHYQNNPAHTSSNYLDRVTSPWSENTKWGNKPSYINLRTIPAPVVESWYEIDITDLYNDWKNNLYPNYGIQLRATDTWEIYNVFYSSEYVCDPTLRPKLIVEVFEIDPIPDIKANGSDGPITVSPNTPVSITVSLDPGDYNTTSLDWWVLDMSPTEWRSYVAPTRWRNGVTRIRRPPREIQDKEILNDTLTLGTHIFYFALDSEVANGSADATWMDSVVVHVQE